MRDRGHQVLYPGLPDPDTPSYDTWASALDDNLTAMDGARRTVIAHSLGCLLWMHRAGGVQPISVPAACDGGPLGWPVDALAGAGHTTPDDGYGRWPSLEAWCRSAAGELRADAIG